MCMCWKLLSWDWWVGIAHGRRRRQGRKGGCCLLGNDSPCRIKLHAHLDRDEFRVSSDHVTVRGGRKAMMGTDGVSAGSRAWDGRSSPSPGSSGLILCLFPLSLSLPSFRPALCHLLSPSASKGLLLGRGMIAVIRRKWETRAGASKPCWVSFPRPGVVYLHKRKGLQ